MGVNVEYLGTPSGILKIIEIVFVVISFGIFRGANTYFTLSDDANYFGGGVLVTCMIITPLLLVCYLMNRVEIQGTIIEPTLNIIFFIFLFSVSIASMVFWSDIRGKSEQKSNGLALACFTLFSSLAYLCDIPFSVINFKRQMDENGFGF